MQLNDATFRRLSYSAEVRGSIQETAPRKTAENTVEYLDGGAGSVVANHRGGSESSVVVTTLPVTDVYSYNRPHLQLSMIVLFGNV